LTCDSAYDNEFAQLATASDALPDDATARRKLGAEQAKNQSIHQFSQENRLIDDRYY
jgi:hypothetical protein